MSCDMLTNELLQNPVMVMSSRLFVLVECKIYIKNEIHSLFTRLNQGARALGGEARGGGGGDLGESKAQKIALFLVKNSMRKLP